MIFLSLIALAIMITTILSGSILLVALFFYPKSTIHNMRNVITHIIDSINKPFLYALLMTTVSILIWFGMHFEELGLPFNSWFKFPLIIASIISISILLAIFYQFNIFLNVVSGRVKAIFERLHSEKHNSQDIDSLKSPTLFIGGLILILLALILSLFLVDLITIFTGISPKLLYNEDYNYLTRLYFGAFAVLAFSVTVYVAYVRQQGLNISQRQYEHAQNQFEYTQQKDLEEEIEKRFLEGIKLLSDKNESVRIGGIFLLKRLANSETKIHANNINLKKESLKSEIINILTEYVRNLTNSKSYLLKNYPSVYKDKYPDEFNELYKHKIIYGDAEYLETPSTEISIIIEALANIDSDVEKDLSNSFLKRLIINNQNLNNFNFESCNLQYSEFNEIKFSNSNFIFSYLDFSRIIDTSFHSCNFKSTNNELSIIKNAFFDKNTPLQNAVFDFAEILNSFFLSDNLDMASFRGVSLKDVSFISVKNALFGSVNSSIGEFSNWDNTIKIIDKYLNLIEEITQNNKDDFIYNYQIDCIDPVRISMLDAANQFPKIIFKGSKLFDFYFIMNKYFNFTMLSEIQNDSEKKDFIIDTYLCMDRTSQQKLKKLYKDFDKTEKAR